MENNAARQNDNTGSCRLWLTWKLIRKQKLRTAAIFLGLLSSVFLLGAFGSFGYDFWMQVHEGAGESAGYDRTQMILISLVTVLLLLVAGCCGILLHNLYSLTFARRWRSLARLTALGAGPRDLFVMTLQENAIFFCACAPPGCALALLAGKAVGIRWGPPLWLMGGILLWIGAVSCVCGVLPLCTALGWIQEKTKYRYKKNRKQISGSQIFCKQPSRRRPQAALSINFSRFMTKRYRRADRGHHIRTILTILAAILLYVPVSYLIDTNISVQRAELDAKHGIGYGCSPRTKAELETALSECGRLADGDSVVYVAMPARACVKTDALSPKLRKLLRGMGWREEELFFAGSTLYFLEDRAFVGFLESADILPSARAILIDRYINRSSWSEDAVPSYRATALLDAGQDCSGVEVWYEAGDEGQWNQAKSLLPDAVTGQIPEGLSFDGSLSLILPLSQMEDFLSPRTDYPGLSVCGKFLDRDKSTFSRLEEILGEDCVGSLRYTREILRDWYDSMSGIHRAMNAICVLLFSIALLNMFSMMLFQYMERRQGLAVLWSLGQSPGGLLRILTGEHIRNLLAALGLGIPISASLCYYIYGIFRQAWQVEYAFPLGQTALIAAAAGLLSLLAILTEALLMRHQDFLKDIREVSGGTL